MHREGWEALPALGHDGHAEAGDGVGALGVDRAAVEDDLAALRAQAADDAADRGALAHAVAPEQRDEPPTRMSKSRPNSTRLAPYPASRPRQRNSGALTPPPPYPGRPAPRDGPSRGRRRPRSAPCQYTSTEMRSASWKTASMSCSMSRIAVSAARLRMSATICCESSGPMPAMAVEQQELGRAASASARSSRFCTPCGSVPALRPSTSMRAGALRQRLGAFLQRRLGVAPRQAAEARPGLRLHREQQVVAHAVVAEHAGDLEAARQAGAVCACGASGEFDAVEHDTRRPPAADRRSG